MANEEHLSILKSGIPEWNKWRHSQLQSYNPIRGKHLSSFAVDLTCADLRVADLSNAQLFYADLTGARLESASLASVNFGGIRIQAGPRIGFTVQLPGANLRNAKLGGALLSHATFDETQLENADFTGAMFGRTRFLDVNLSAVKGLEFCEHNEPSYLDYFTLLKSGSLPLAFLRGCGLPDSFINYLPSLFQQPIQFYSCFISYSSKDQDCAERLYADLQSKGVRCWFAPEDMKIGAKLRSSFGEAIRLHDKLIVLLSENSLKSSWVEKEVETAFENERQQNRVVLFPIRLDDAITETNQAWAADIRRSRLIGDFRNWKNRDSYKEGFDRLLRDLKAEGKAESAAQK
jgi:uncharacterized protein YjbI with pentapeptide repeats